MRWHRTKRSDEYLRALRDRHYSTRKPGGRTVGPPGRTLSLRTLDGRAGWITSYPLEHLASHGYGDALVCTLFRNEAEELLSSGLVGEAVAASAYTYGIPTGGFLTFVDSGKVRRKRDPGRCFRRAGFEHVGFTKDRGLVVLRLEPVMFPAPVAPLDLQLELGVAAA